MSDGKKKTGRIGKTKRRIYNLYVRSLEKFQTGGIMKTGMKRLMPLMLLLLAGCAGLHSGGREASVAGTEKNLESTVLAKSVSSWNGDMLPVYPAGQPEISVLRIKIPPGASLPVHKHPVINAGFMLEGELTVQTESGAVLHLKAGEAIVEVVDTWHSGRNEGSVPAEIVVFYAGTESKPVTVYRKQ